MKKLLLTFTLLFSTLMFSSPSYGEWTKVSERNGNTYYVDFERIRKVDGYVYWWHMSDYLKPLTGVVFSETSYNQGDCKVFRVKYLSSSFYKEHMGGGTGKVIPPPPEYKSWQYPLPNSILEIMLKAVCNH